MNDYELFDMESIDCYGYSDRLPEGYAVYEVLYKIHPDSGRGEHLWFEAPESTDFAGLRNEASGRLRALKGRNADVLGIDDVTERYTSATQDMQFLESEGFTTYTAEFYKARFDPSLAAAEKSLVFVNESFHDERSDTEGRCIIWKEGPDWITEFDSDGAYRNFYGPGPLQSLEGFCSQSLLPSSADAVIARAHEARCAVVAEPSAACHERLEDAR